MESDQLPKTQWFTISPPKKPVQMKPSAKSKVGSRSPLLRPRPIPSLKNDETENIEDASADEEVPTLKLMRFAAAPWLNFGCAKFYPTPSANVPIRKTLNIYNPTERAETVYIDKMSGTNGFVAERDSFEVPALETVPITFTWTPASIGNARENVTIKTNALRLKVILFATATEKLGVKNVKVNIEIHTRDQDGAPQVLTSSFTKTQATDDLQAIEKAKRANIQTQAQTNRNRAQVFTSSRYSSTAQTPTSNGASSRLSAKALEMRTPLKTPTSSGAAAASNTGKRPSHSTLAESAIKRRKLAESDLKTPSKHAQQQSQTEVLESAVKGLFKKYASDSRWMEKQEAAFKEWLNFVLKNEIVGGTSEHAEDRSVTARTNLAAKAKDAKSLMTPKQLALLKRKSTVKQNARMFFTGSESTRVLGRLKSEIEGGKLRIVDEKFIWADLGLRQHVTDLFIQNYGTHHLHLALETFFGEVISLHAANGADYSVSLAKFFVKRVLFDEEVAAKFEGRIKELYQPGFKEALDTVVLYRVLSLVWLLDRFKSQGLLEDNSFAGVAPGSTPFGPSMSDDNVNLACLFRATSQIKSSSELLCNFAQQFLPSEGDILRRMSLVGYSLQHHQTYLDEFDFTVRSLSVDLRDGIRLSRVAELLSKRFDSNLPSVLPTLRVPAISRLQKIHNLNQAMHRLRQCGVGMNEADARELVDGKQSKTLAYLWQVIIHAHLPHVISVSTLQREIERIAENNLIAKITAEFKQVSSPVLHQQGFTEDSDPSACVFFNSELFSAILAWSQGVCAHYGVSISNFTTSFSDGRALCYLIHYYAPELLDISKVQQHTSTKLEEKLNAAIQEDSLIDLDELPTSPGPIDGNWVGVYSPPSGTSTQLKAVLEAETQNFALLRCAIAKLGFVPQLANAFDMSNTLPDEKVVVTLLAFLSARLIELVSERAATITLQRAFRRWHSACSHVREARAIVKIQAFIRGAQQRKKYLELRHAAVLVQSAVRGKLARRLVEKQRAALTIQSWWRMVLARKQLAQKEAAAVKIQAWWRSIMTRKQVDRWEKAALVVQKNLRMVLAQHQFVALNQAAITIQSAIRARNARIYAERTKAALKIQSWWRMVLAKKELARNQDAALKIQSWWRMVSAQRSFNKLQESALMIQSAIRGRQARLEYAQKENAIIKIQSWFRMVSQRRSYESYQLEKRNCAALKIQSWWRMKMAQRDFVEKSSAALKIQSWWRMVQVKRAFERQERAAVAVQTAWRAKLCKRRYEVSRNAALKLQSWWRMIMARKHFAQLEESAVKIQSVMRMKLVELRLKREKEREEKEALTLEMAVLRIQALWKGYKARRDAKIAKIAQLRARIEHKRANTPISQTLGYRTNAALKTLLETQKLSDIVSACQVLEESTMYSDQCARYVIEVEALPILFGVIATCNRSAPHISVLKIILNVVTYMCRWRETRSGLVAQQPDVLERLANVATSFKDVPEVFNRACAAFVAIAKPQPESAQTWLLSHASSASSSASSSSSLSSSSSSNSSLTGIPRSRSNVSAASVATATSSNVSSAAAQSVKSTLARLAALEEHINKRLNMEKKAKKPANLLALTQESLTLIMQIHSICKKAALMKKN